jgi:uncharacterized protein (DUF2141 family)
MNTLVLPIWRNKSLLFQVFLVLCITGIHAQSSTKPEGDLVITFTDFRSEVGTISMGLYTHEKQWTDKPLQSFRWTKEDLNKGVLTVRVEALAYGKYACAVLDDEDDNQSMNYILGLPREGWGMSTNPSFLRLKAPAFEDVSFNLDAPVVRFEIKMNYLNKNKQVE